MGILRYIADLIGDSGSGGVHGLVPAPAAGDAAASKFLKADGTWATAGGAAVNRTLAGITANYTIVAGDLGKVIEVTNNSVTVSVTAAATLGSGFYCTIWNLCTTSTHVTTIDPNSTETIDGVSTLLLHRGEGVTITSDGTNIQIGEKKYQRGYAENISPTATRPIASGDRALAIGTNTVASGAGSLSIGANPAAPTTASGSASIALGGDASAVTASGTYSIAIGEDNIASGDCGIAIGCNSSGAGSRAVTGAGAVAFGGSYASGTDSFCAANVNRTSTYGATGVNSIAMGLTAKASGSGSMAIGRESAATSSFALAIGGIACTAGGSGSSAIGAATTASGVGAVALNGSSIGYAVASGLRSIAIGNGALAEEVGKIAIATGKITTDGDFQRGEIHLYGATTTNSTVVLTSDGAAATTTNQLIAASNKVIVFTGKLIGKQTGSANIAAYTIVGTLVNNAGTVTMPTGTLTLIGTDSIGLGTVPTLAADNTNKGLTVTSGNKTTTTIKWACILETLELTYA